MWYHSPEQASRPVPQDMNLLVLEKLNFLLVGSRGWAGKPAPKRFIDNGARCEVKLIYCTIFMNRLSGLFHELR
jgi:hypothetical protein